MEKIYVLYEMDKDPGYKGEIVFYNFRISYDTEPVFDKKHKKVRLVANFEYNKLFDKLGPILEKKLKWSLSSIINVCKESYNKKRAEKDKLEEKLKKLEINNLEGIEDWCLYGEASMEVSSELKSEIERIAFEED